jgi:hypothetical protein
MADMNITVTIPQDKAQRIIEAMKGLYPIPKVPDPAWVDPGDGSEAPLVNQHTDVQWARVVVVQWIKAQEARYRQAKVRSAVTLDIDDSIVA